MNREVTVSIIIPIYNVRPYIERCISSVLKSTFNDYELLLIDDGSTDGSGELCDRYAGHDDRITVFHEDNQGVSAARNKGIENAKGYYILFIDSDDYIDQTYIENILIQGNEDLVWAGYKDVKGGETIFDHPKENGIISIIELKNMLKQKGRNQFPFTVWCMCYKHSIISDNNIRFQKQLSLGEDFLFNLDYLKHCNIIRTVSGSLYYYEQVTNSLRNRFCWNYDELFEEEGRRIDEFCDGWDYKVRNYRWHTVLQYYEKWKTVDHSLSSECRRHRKACYKNQYYRETIPYMRKYGSFDEKVETYCMGYYRHIVFNWLIKQYKRYKQVR